MLANLGAFVVLATITAGTPFKVTSDAAVQRDVAVAWSNGTNSKYLVQWTENADQTFCTGNADVYCAIVSIDGSGNASAGAKFSCGSEGDDDRAGAVAWDPVNLRWGAVKTNAVVAGSCSKMDEHLYTTSTTGTSSTSLKMSNLGIRRRPRMTFHVAVDGSGTSGGGTDHGWHTVVELNQADVCRMKHPPILSGNGSLDCANFTLGLTGNDIEPDIANRRPTDDSLIVFAHDAADAGYDIRGVVVTDNGATDATLDQGAVFDIATGTARQRNPRLAYNSVDDTGWLVVWEESPDGTAGSWDVKASFVTVGSPPVAGTPFTVTTASGDQRLPAVAHDPTKNRFLVVWSDGGATIKGAELDETGAVTQTDVLLSPSTGSHTRPWVAAGGSWLVAYEDGSSSDIYATRVTSDATTLAADFESPTAAVVDGGVEIRFSLDVGAPFVSAAVHRNRAGEPPVRIASFDVLEAPGGTVFRHLDEQIPPEAAPGYEYRIEGITSGGDSIWSEPFGTAGIAGRPAGGCRVAHVPVSPGSGRLALLAGALAFAAFGVRRQRSR